MFYNLRCFFSYLLFILLGKLKKSAFEKAASCQELPGQFRYCQLTHSKEKHTKDLKT